MMDKMVTLEIWYEKKSETKLILQLLLLEFNVHNKRLLMNERFVRKFRDKFFHCI